MNCHRFTSWFLFMPCEDHLTNYTYKIKIKNHVTETLQSTLSVEDQIESYHLLFVLANQENQRLTIIALSKAALFITLLESCLALRETVLFQWLLYSSEQVSTTRYPTFYISLSGFHSVKRCNRSQHCLLARTVCGQTSYLEAF